MKANNIPIGGFGNGEQKSSITNVDASTWYTGWYSMGYRTDGARNALQFQTAKNLYFFAYVVLVNDTKLSELLGVKSLYLDNGTSIIFKGSNSFFGYILDENGLILQKLYNGTGFIVKKDGTWYVFPLAVEGFYCSDTGLESPGSWTYVLQQLIFWRD